MYIQGSCKSSSDRCGECPAMPTMPKREQTRGRSKWHVKERRVAVGLCFTISAGQGGHLPAVGCGNRIGDDEARAEEEDIYG